MVILDGHSLTIEDLAKIAYQGEKVSISPNAKTAIADAHETIVTLCDSERPIYGVNTGYGIFADKKISKSQSVDLNRNLIYSHAVATGDPLPEYVVRAAMAIRINTLAKGASGIQPAIVEALVDMLNKNLTPYVSSKGSLGSSGDLCLLAQVGLVLISGKGRETEESGMAYFGEQLLPGSEAMQRAGIKPVEFSHKDGLGLINGATFSAAVAALMAFQAKQFVQLADGFTSLSLEALCGRSDAFNREIHALRNMDGQQDSAATIRKLTSGSTFLDSTSVVQDAYSLRCAPQVHGSVRDTVAYATGIITKEINAATDNPLIVNGKEIISGGNFHGAPIGMVSDFLAIALTELGAISERRLFRLMDEALNNGLPAMLVDPMAETGLNSGVMILQYTAAALVLENQTLAAPDSLRSLPTSANQEDHNANAFNAAMNLAKIAENLRKILSIEYYCAARATNIRLKRSKEKKLGDGTREMYDHFWEQFHYQVQDGQWRTDLEKLYSLMHHPNPFNQQLLSIVN